MDRHVQLISVIQVEEPFCLMVNHANEHFRVEFLMCEMHWCEFPLRLLSIHWTTPTKNKPTTGAMPGYLVWETDSSLSRSIFRLMPMHNNNNSEKTTSRLKYFHCQCVSLEFTLHIDHCSNWLNLQTRTRRVTHTRDGKMQVAASNDSNECHKSQT